MDAYNTNLASEFYVLSVLHRLGADANLTLANKKSVDIAVIRGAGDTVTIDVKGIAAKGAWLVHGIKAKPRHFIVFVSFLGKISDPAIAPEVYVVPSDKVKAITHKSNGWHRVPFPRLRKDGAKYKDAWKLVL